MYRKRKHSLRNLNTASNEFINILSKRTCALKRDWKLQGVSQAKLFIELLRRALLGFLAVPPKMVLNLTKKDTAEEITFKNYRKCKITLTRLVTCRFVQSTLLYKEQRNFCYDNCFRLSGISVILLILNLLLFELINYWLIVLFSLINNLYESGAHQTTCIIQPILQPAFENLHTYIFYFVMQVSSTVKTFTADMDLPRKYLSILKENWQYWRNFNVRKAQESDALLQILLVL